MARKTAKHEPRPNQFSVRVVPHWNELPDEVKSQPSFIFFKNAYDNIQNLLSNVEDVFKKLSEDGTFC